MAELSRRLDRREQKCLRAGGVRWKAFGNSQLGAVLGNSSKERRTRWLTGDKSRLRAHRQMAREVRGSTKSLLQAIEDGDVPRPGLLGYQDWNSWRAREGQRPSKIRDGDERTTSTAEEAQLWRNVMEALKDQLAFVEAPP